MAAPLFEPDVGIAEHPWLRQADAGYKVLATKRVQCGIQTSVCPPSARLPLYTHPVVTFYEWVFGNDCSKRPFEFAAWTLPRLRACSATPDQSFARFSSPKPDPSVPSGPQERSSACTCTHELSGSSRIRCTVQAEFAGSHNHDWKTWGLRRSFRHPHVLDSSPCSRYGPTSTDLSFKLDRTLAKPESIQPDRFQTLNPGAKPAEVKALKP